MAEKPMKRFVIMPNNNQLVVEFDDGEVLDTQMTSLLDLTLQWVHAIQGDVAAGTVTIEFVQPPPMTMTIEEFHAKFGGDSSRRHLDEVTDVVAARREVLVADKARMDAELAVMETINNRTEEQIANDYRDQQDYLQMLLDRNPDSRLVRNVQS